MFMRILFFVTLFIFPGAGFGKGPVAVVASLVGDASVQPPQSQTPAPLHVLDWLDAGARIEVHAKSTMKLILLNGRTYELSAGARATAGADALTAVNSQVRESSRLPPIPRVAPIIVNTAEVPGATAIRGGSRVRSLYPNDVQVIASQLKLSFAAMKDASNYGVILEDEQGNSLFRVSTTATSVDVPADALKPGLRYTWRVRAFGDSGVIAGGSAEFETMSEEELDRRSAFAAALRTEDEAVRLALIAEVDQQIGLLADACDEFEAAVRLRPSDPGLLQAQASAKAALAAARDR